MAVLGADLLAGLDAQRYATRFGVGLGEPRGALLSLGGVVEVGAVAHGPHAERGVQIDALPAQKPLGERARGVAHEPAAGDDREAVARRERLLVAGAEVGAADELVHDGGRGRVVGGEHEPKGLFLLKGEVEVLVLARRADVDQHIARLLGDDPGSGQRVAGAGKVEDHGASFLRAFVLPPSIAKRPCACVLRHAGVSRGMLASREPQGRVANCGGRSGLECFT